MKKKDYRHLFSQKPCKKAREWLKTQPDLRTAWDNCERGDWLWWALRMSEYEIPKEKSVAFALDCEERVAYDTYAAYAAAYVAYVAAAAHAAAYAAAHAAAYAADAAADAAAERKHQADWIRSQIECPFDQPAR